VGNARARRWEPAALIAAIWVVQAVVFIAAPAVFVGLQEESGDVLRNLQDSDCTLFGLVVATFMSAVQGAFLLPIREPLAKDDPGPSWLRLLAVAVCLAAIIGGVAAYVAVELDAGNILSINDRHAYAIFWITTAALSIPAFFILLRRYRRALPVKISMAMAALLGGVVLAGLALGVFGVVRLITDAETPAWAWYWILVPSPLVGWAVFTPLIIAFVRKGPPEARLSKLAARLLIGTTIEAVAIIPVNIMVRRKSACYCDEASFWSLVASISVGLVTLGPAVYLLVWKRYHLRVAEGCCRACGYDMRGIPSAQRCPECGAGWTA
jgi:hypothetical protein